MDLAEFLLACFAKDEADARIAQQNYAAITIDFPHGAWDPARVLAECEAKRLIVESFVEAWNADDMLFDAEEYDGVLRLLALPYADHPDYREEWRP